MDPLELLELTDNLNDALDQLNTADPDDALAVLDAVEAVQAALEAMGDGVAPQPAAADPVETIDMLGFNERDYTFLKGVINGDYSNATGDLLKGFIQRGDSITLELSKRKGRVPPKANQLVQDAMLVLLGMPSEPATNPLYQSVLDGAAVTIDLVKQVRAEGQKDPDHPQLRPAVRVIHGAVKAMAA